jgi:hypothetical protein
MFDRDPAQCVRARKADRATAHGLRGVGDAMRSRPIIVVDVVVRVAARAMQRVEG